MLDINYIRDHLDLVRQKLADKGEGGDLDRLLELDGQRRALIGQTEQLKKQKNEASKKIAEAKKNKQDATDLIGQMQAVSAQEKAIDSKLAEVRNHYEVAILEMPNLAADDVPVGTDESGNVEVDHWGERISFDFAPKPHWELGKALGILDLEASAKISGAGFIVTRDLGARLERALATFLLDVNREQHGYTEVAVPFLVNRQAMFGSGQFPKMEDDAYKCDREELYPIPTAEVPLINLHAGEILSEEQLSIDYMAHSACFRREAGSYGKDTRGIIRVHQFNKVELVKIVPAGGGPTALDQIVDHARNLLTLLGLEHRVLLMCTGDTGFQQRKKFDLEVWAPGVGRYLEVSSCSDCGDFQARRASIRYRDAKGQVHFPDTLNGSALALPRTLVAILETYQQADGSVRVPEALIPYMNGIEMIRPER